jgi:uncharacterized protein YbjQ (UPF0145 family)
MIITTTSQLDNKPVSQYLGFISAEVIVGANIVKDMFAWLTDIFGGRSSSYETSLIEGKNAAMQELIAKAEKLWADGIIGVDMAYGAVGKWSMFMINITGTAVKF